MKRRLTILLVAVAAFAAWFEWSARPLPLQGESRHWLNAGAAAIATVDLELRDHKRASPRVRTRPEVPYRDLPTRVWYPKAGGGYPLVIFSHGFSQGRDGARSTAEALARLGYVVAAADFPSTSSRARPHLDITDVINQPGDVSFVIDQLLALQDDPGHRLFGKIDRERIGAFGTSLGAMTTTMVGFDPARHDPRVKAIVAQAGPSMMFGREYFSHRQLPMLIIAGTADLVVDYESNARSAIERAPESLLMTIHGGTHSGFAPAGALLRWWRNPDQVLCRLLTRRVGTLPSAWDLLGSAADGIVIAETIHFCDNSRPPAAINPVRQEWLVQLATTSFFESRFNPDPARRAARHAYLMETMPRENPDVEIRGGGEQPRPSSPLRSVPTALWRHSSELGVRQHAQLEDPRATALGDQLTRAPGGGSSLRAGSRRRRQG